MTLSILLAAMLFEGVRGRYSTTLTYEKPTADPIWFGGESRADKAYARDPKALRAARAELAQIIEGNGLLRDADGREVAAFGVNYYAPFWSDYEALTSRGLDLHRVIDDEILMQNCFFTLSK